jgi:6-pyruvoyltetrahydropterin/6-carboxytetrahydropterin synthase
MTYPLHKVSCSRILKCDAGHRIWGHENKCASLHGHEYFFDVHTRCAELDSIGRIIDFSVIKGVIGNWVDEHWDHGLILWEMDPLAKWFVEESPHFFYHEKNTNPFFGQKYFLLPFNPTAENLASYLLKVSNELLLGAGLKKNELEVWKVVCQETSNCSAVAEL